MYKVAIFVVLAICLADQVFADEQAKSDRSNNAAQPSIALLKPDLRLEIGFAQKTLSIPIQARDLNDDLMKLHERLVIRDRGLPVGSKVVVDVDGAGIVELNPGKNSRDWVVPITFKNLGPNTVESRILEVSLALSSQAWGPTSICFCPNFGQYF